jgi:hypothetical protein
LTRLELGLELRESSYGNRTCNSESLEFKDGRWVVVVVGGGGAILDTNCRSVGTLNLTTKPNDETDTESKLG